MNLLKVDTFCCALKSLFLNLIYNLFNLKRLKGTCATLTALAFSLLLFSMNKSLLCF